MLQSNLALDLLQHDLSFVAADRLQPTWRFRHGFTHVLDNECSYATNREHDAPASPRDEQCADKRAERQAGYHGTVQDAASAATRLGSQELGHCSVARDQFRSQTHAHHSTKKN